MRFFNKVLHKFHHKNRKSIYKYKGFLLKIFLRIYNNSHNDLFMKRKDLVFTKLFVILIAI